MQLEILVIDLIGRLRNPTLDSIMLFFTNFGSGKIVAVLVFLLVLFFLYYKKNHQAVLLAIIFAGGEAIVSLTKYLVERIRPEILSHLVETDGFSFPSGHSFAVTIFFGMTGYFLTKELKTKKMKFLVWLVVLAIIGTVGFSRIYLGVHWPTDVLGSYIMAFLWIFLVFYIFNKKVKKIE